MYRKYWVAVSHSYLLIVKKITFFSTAICDKKPHWDKRYYIEIVYGRGEIVRPCPAGTIFFEEKCACDFGLSGLLPTTPDGMYIVHFNTAFDFPA